MTEAIQSKTDRKLSYTIMVDKPDAHWEDTTEGLLCTLDNCSTVIAAMNPEDPQISDYLQDLYEVTWTNLSRISHALRAHMDAGQEHTDQVRQQIAEEIAEGQKD